jgi:menaquinone-dependent protoporphyrinogen oxidase
MQQEVLITYGSRSRSTKEVAEAIGATMKEAGVQVDVRPMEKLTSISDDTSLVMGTAFYGGHFPKEFRRFLKQFQRELGNVRPWIFVLVPAENEGKHFASAEEEARQELAKYPWLHTADVRVMGGSVNPRHLGLPFLISLAMKLNPMRKVPASDVRDWDFIRRWAEAVAEHMKKEPTEQRGEFAEYSSYRKSLLGS